MKLEIGKTYVLDKTDSFIVNAVNDSGLQYLITWVNGTKDNYGCKMFDELFGNRIKLRVEKRNHFPKWF